MMDLHQRRQAEFEKYRKVYRDFPRYTNRHPRINLTCEWIESHRSAGSLLDVGAGRGEVLDEAWRRFQIVTTGCDVVDELAIHPDIDLIEGAHALPYDSAAFGLVTCTDVMEHLLMEDVSPALSELARVSRGPVLLTICHRPDTPGKYGPDTLHITVRPREWWEMKIWANMDPTRVRAIYTDRVNENGTWFEVLCG